MKRINLGIAAVFGVTLLSGGAAIADECTQMCRETARDCRSQVRDARRMCAEDGGCDVLRDDYRATCEEEGRDSEACQSARDSLRACFEPCRDVGSDLRSECRTALDTCLVDECGREPRPNRPGRFRR